MRINNISNQNYYINNNQSKKTVNTSPNFGRFNVQETFNKITEPAVGPLSKVYEAFPKNGFAQKAMAAFSRSDKTFTHISVFCSFVLSSFYTINALKSKKIDKEQKPQMVINDALTFGVSAGTSYLLDGIVTKHFNNFVDGYMKKHNDFYSTLSADAIKNTKAGFNKIKSLMILGLVYRYLGPVLVTPLANKLSAKLFEKKQTKEA